MLRSMTAYATRTGAHGPFSWTWELRGVNGKGLDIRTRLPDWIEGLEQALRGALTGALKRGNIQASLKITRADGPDGKINKAAVESVLAGLKSIEEMAAHAAVPLAPTTAADILTMRAVTDSAAQDDGGEALAAAVKADIAPLLAAFSAMRADEGAALTTVIGGQLDEIAAQVAAAKALLPDRAAAQASAFRAGLARVMADVEIDEGRVAQELAQLAIKSDVMEEIDRLEAHNQAAQVLIKNPDPVGRKRDFLMQEFNREANTLCSKAADSALTQIGLNLKVTIDQMREQIQNVE